MSKNLMEKMTVTAGWRDLTPAAQVLGEGNSVYFLTGEWRTETPVWKKEQCKQCLFCFPVCPDSSIPVANSKRDEFDLDHCKGCGICAKVCPFGAISMKAPGKEASK
ncbi:MAG: 4Fe-4S binding protein [Clostridiales Family XIII bacterium]|jgi:pyruvate ferredoxin oxidoreductase delta subunit|nr:4Fe-4S binding protein [Clostridiales Family XIII bacterium]